MAYDRAGEGAVVVPALRLDPLPPGYEAWARARLLDAAGLADLARDLRRNGTSIVGQSLGQMLAGLAALPLAPGDAAVVACVGVVPVPGATPAPVRGAVSGPDDEALLLRERDAARALLVRCAELLEFYYGSRSYGRWRADLSKLTDDTAALLADLRASGVEVPRS